MAKRPKKPPVQRIDPGTPVHVCALHPAGLIAAIGYWSDRLPLVERAGRLVPAPYTLSIDSVERDGVQMLVASLLPQGEGGNR